MRIYEIKMLCGILSMRRFEVHIFGDSVIRVFMIDKDVKLDVRYSLPSSVISHIYTTCMEAKTYYVQEEINQSLQEAPKTNI